MNIFKNPRFLNLSLILTSFIGYLEWGGGNSLFLIQAEIDIISALFVNPTSVLHPFVLMPLAGQLVLAYTLFLKEPNKVLTYVGIIGVGLLLLFMFLIGIIGFNYKILISTLPFLTVAFFTIKLHRAKKSET